MKHKLRMIWSILRDRHVVGSSTTEFTLVDYPPMDDRLSNELLKSSDRLKQEVNKEQC